MPRALVVGGGLAGLVAAHALGDAGWDVTVLEAASRPGGVVRSERAGGYLLEWGPQTYLEEREGALDRAIARVGLQGEVLRPSAAAKRRLVLQGSRLHAIPADLLGLLGPLGLLRAGAELLLPARVGLGPETVADFARRRFGRRAAGVLFDALVTGIFAGDPQRLELHTALPRLFALEAEHGGVIRAGLSGRFRPRGMASLRGGLGRLVEALGAALGPRLRLSCAARRVAAPAHPGAAWRVVAEGGEHEAEALVLALPAWGAAQLLVGAAPALAGLLGQIPYAPVAVVSLGYPAAAFPAGVPAGFGFLVPHREGRISLGCLFPAAVFPGEAAPPGHVQLRVLVGGRRRPEAVLLPEGELVDRVRSEVEPLLGAQAAPELTRVFRVPRAIPQYELGHGALLERIEGERRLLPGLWLTGNAYRGVSLPDVAADAERVAEAVTRGPRPALS